MSSRNLGSVTRRPVSIFQPSPPPSLLRWSLVFCKPHAFSVPLGPIRKRGTAFLPACLPPLPSRRTGCLIAAADHLQRGAVPLLQGFARADHVVGRSPAERLTLPCTSVGSYCICSLNSDRNDYQISDSSVVNREILIHGI